jgi:hypothetical protein
MCFDFGLIFGFVVFFWVANYEGFAQSWTPVYSTALDANMSEDEIGRIAEQVVELLEDEIREITEHVSKLLEDEIWQINK